MARRKKETIQIPTKKCLHCGMELEYKNFYQLHNFSNIYSGNDNYIPICKDCLKIIYEQLEIQYANQFSVLGMKSDEKEAQKLAVRRLCMTFDIYYSNRLFDAALKQIERFPTIDMVTAYMKISNLKQSKGKSYDDTILEENLSQKLLKSAITDKIMERFNNADNELYQDIYTLCMKLMKSLKGRVNVHDCKINN